ncbi:hypothetical protein PUV_10010 [Parachlamydia acanthamoebae UV-7]|uniref:Mutator family transposase n=2 Tax=Parachlamydia acanthamoebae TaxID=83552 RepID=F8KYJ7_PARAV|nr:hypothetical protein DB43_EF00380 [Parachlamydia acanthamoebae]CCB85951.1 hypothetical protein PUV_10010 [Parachlamydia acanthamoebae UV-7]
MSREKTALTKKCRSAQHELLDKYIRTTNPIESTFATIRHRIRETKGCGSRTATLAMVYKLLMEAQKRWRKLKGHELISKLILGVQFKDGEEVFNVKYTA